MWAVLRTLTARSLSRGCDLAFVGGVFTAFLYTPSQEETFMGPRVEHCPSGQVGWKLKRVMRGLDSVPQALTYHHAPAMERLDGQRLKPEPNPHLSRRRPDPDCDAKAKRLGQDLASAWEKERALSPNGFCSRTPSLELEVDVDSDCAGSPIRESRQRDAVYS